MTDRRHHVRIVDCTIRDGGLCNDWRFDDAFVRRTFGALRDAGVDLMEVGYQTAPGVDDSATVGPWKDCREEDLARVVEVGQMRLACMVDVGRFRATDLRPKASSVIDTIRVACYHHQVDEGLAIAERALELGYDAFVNVMAVTTCTPQEVDAFLDKLGRSPVPNVSVVDSFGAMYPHQLRYLIRKYKNWLRPDQKVGVHLHNNQQTAFANAIASIDEGADWLDASIFGMGRGAGNVPLELLLMYLDDPRHDVRPILGLVDAYTRLREDLRWGYEVPYAVTGWLNLHPRAAIERMRADTPDSLAFYENLTASRPPRRHHRGHRETS
jgi:4-hydroxy 2-oxovalerate aldolase